MGHGGSDGRRGVFVLGMHRSGTSATMRVLNLLGLPACLESDFIPGLEGNPRGHFESATLVEIDHAMLARAHGFWWSPPTDRALADAWADDGLAQSARRRFLAVHTTPQWVCKDPLCCLTMPFWANALQLDPVVVAVSRNPLEVVGSLQQRGHMPKLLALALWERYTRAMLGQLQGRPAFVSDYAELLSDPARWCETAHRFLVGAGLELPAQNIARAAASLEPGLRHRQIGLEELEHDPDVTRSQRELYRLALSLSGADQRASVPLPPQSPDMERRLRRARWLDKRLRRRVRRRLDARRAADAARPPVA